MAFSRQILTLTAALALALPVMQAANTQVSSEKPIINFRLPMFTPEGNRAWLARGSEARFVSREQIDVKELNLTVFSEKILDKVETMILSPSATLLPSQTVVTGKESIRVINDEFEANGIDWRYEHKAQHITIKKNVRVVFRTELGNLLQ